MTLSKCLNHLNGWGDIEMVGEGNCTLHLQEGWWAVVGLTCDVCKMAWVNYWASRDNNRIIKEGAGEGERTRLDLVGENKRGGRGLIGVHVSIALFPCVLFCLTLG